MVTVAVVGVLAATAIPAFIKYTRKARTSEARQNVRKIYDGARQYYIDRNAAAATDMQMLLPQFPEDSGVSLTPATRCCLNAGMKCEPEATQWEIPMWLALHFAVPDPHYFQYDYARTGGVYPIDSFEAIALGDQDCDNTPSLFGMYGFVNPLYADGPIGTGLIMRFQELE
jgi:type II secretory pathway pseudopilin PulG